MQPRHKTDLIAKRPFKFKSPSTHRVCYVAPGDPFWITRSLLDPRGYVCIARRDKAHGYNYAFSPQQIAELFDIVGD